MPWGWIVFKTPTGSEHDPSTSSNPGLPTDPVKLRAFVANVVKNADATLYAMYFEVGAPRVHAVVKGLDDYKKAAAVARILHATSYTKLLDPRQAKGSRGLEPDFRKESRTRRKTSDRNPPA